MFEAAAQAIKDRLLANWSATPVQLPNESMLRSSGGDVEAPDDAPWVALAIDGDAGEALSIGDPGANLHREFGMIWLHVFTPRGTGDATARAHAAALRALFESKDFSGVSTDAATPPRGEDIENETGKWHRLSIAVPFDCDHTA